MHHVKGVGQRYKVEFKSGDQEEKEAEGLFWDEMDRWYIRSNADKVDKQQHVDEISK